MMMFLIAMTFLAGFLLVFAVNLFLADVQLSQRQSVRLRLEQEWRTQNAANARLDYYDQNRGRRPEDSSAFLYSETEPALTWRQRLVDFVRQSGKQTSPERLLFWSLLAAIAAGSIPGVVFHKWLASAAIALVAAAVPWIYIWRARARRLEHLRSQLPDVFDFMARVLRAGQTISQALENVGDEFSRPASDEFGYAYEQQNLGLSSEAVMRELARRTGLLELKIFVLAVAVHRQTGGNLADLLNKLAMIIRDRYRVRGTIRSMTAEGRLQAFILLALPPLLLGAITLINRPYATILYQHPNLLVGMFGFMIAGAVWMQRIVNFDF
jgi:tight adherence protein B